jgi:aspartyl-tRNA(Asn)/glutamyl-tRNA(Gln) amidotransferase subunit C
MPSAKITKEQVKHIAKLAKLEVSGEEERFAELLSDTLDYIEILNELDTSKVSETYQVTGLTNVYQKDDENKATITQKEALSNAKEVKGGLIVTKGVFENR